MADKENSRRFRNQYHHDIDKRTVILNRKDPLKYLKDKNINIKKPMKPVPPIALGINTEKIQSSITPTDPYYYSGIFTREKHQAEKEKNEDSSERDEI